MKPYEPISGAPAFAIVAAVRERARQLENGAPPLVPVAYGETPTSVAQHEIEAWRGTIAAMKIRIIGTSPNPAVEETLAAVEIANGLGALATYTLTATKTTPAASVGAISLLAANVSRKAARIITNNGISYKLSGALTGTVVINWLP